MNKTALLYLGALAPDSPEAPNAATSRAAQIFQTGFLDALVRSGCASVELRHYCPVPSFPRERRLFVGPARECVAGRTSHRLSHLNLGPIKVLTLAVTAAWSVLRWSLKNRGNRRVVVSYNLNAPPAYLVAPLCRVLGVKFVPFVGDLYVPGEVVPDTWLRRLEFRLQTRLLPRVDGLLVCNRAIIDDFAPASHHMLIEGGVQSVFDPLTREDNGTFNVVFAGQLSELNGVRLALAAFREWHDPDARLIVMGRGPLASEVAAAAVQDPRIDFRGMVDHIEVHDAYRSADLLLNLRATDNKTHRYVFPSKVVECLATGVPLLSTRTGHVEEEFGEFVFMLEEETAHALANRLAEIKAMRAADRISFGQSAREHVRKTRTWDAHIAKLAEYLEDSVFNEPDSKMRVLAFVDYYLPGYKGGGPAVSLSRMAENIKEDVELFVFTRDRDLGEVAPYGCANDAAWVRRPESRVHYAPPDSLGPLAILPTLRSVRPDVVYLNSFFSKMTRSVLVLRWLGLLRGIGVVIAPRGELSEGALGIKSSKKRLYLSACRRLRLYQGLLWQPSTGLERSEIERHFGDVDCFVLPERPAAPSHHTGPEKVSGECRFVFVSRVSRKKNVEYALELLAGVKGRVTFDIYGPVEDEAYRAQIEGLIARLPENVQAHLRGPIPPTEVPSAMAQAHWFLFPTLGENFGHVIAEALAAGTPCLLSDQTPWSDLDPAGAGRAVPLADRQQWIDTLQACVEADQQELDRIRAQVRAYYESKRREFGAGGSKSLFERAA